MSAALHAVRNLDAIATSIRDAHEAAADGHRQQLETYLSMGRDLLEARALLPSNKAFGEWFNTQEFAFSRVWAWTLRTAAEHEPEVRAAFVTQVTDGEEPNLKKALVAVRSDEEPAAPAELAELPIGVFRTIVADPPWQYDNTSTRGAAEDHYETMSIVELCAPNFARQIEARAADESHLYLWTTNGFLRDAFEVMDAWGFTYKTLLTWVKPQIGMGNYFRSCTEHVLFGIRGGLRTEDRAARNWFESSRGKHSAKPDCFYDLVEKCSAGPYLEMFARRRRLGWDSWGHEA